MKIRKHRHLRLGRDMAARDGWTRARALAARVLASRRALAPGARACAAVVLGRV